MQQKAQVGNSSIQRNYDDDPIVIKDYARSMSLWLFVVFVLVLYSLALVLPSSQFTFTNLAISVSIFVLPILYKSWPIIHENSEIILTNNHITRHWGDKVDGIAWSPDINVEKSFIDFFDKHQADASWQRYIGAIFNVVCLHPISLVAKVFYHFYRNGLNSYRFFDTIVIRDGEEMITILITNNHDYTQLKAYLYAKDVDIERISIFYTPFYLPIESAAKDN